MNVGILIFYKKNGFDQLRTFPKWSEIEELIPNRLFRKKFHMAKFQFELLTRKIADTIGDDVFRSEISDIDGFLCGECKVAIALRVLFGGSYADIVGHVFGVKSIQTIYEVF